MTRGADQRPIRSAIRMASGPEQDEAISKYLTENASIGFERFLPKDDDELNAALCAGKYERAVFGDLDALMSAVWKGQAEWDRWKAAGVQIELIQPPVEAPTAWPAVVEAVYRSLAGWRARQRRRQIIAGFILSVLAIAAVAALFWSVPPPR